MPLDTVLMPGCAVDEISIMIARLVYYSEENICRHTERGDVANIGSMNPALEGR